MGKVFLISDPHFYHEKVIAYENRPFKDIKEMNNVIIHNWNSIVNKDDKIFVLGDFGFGSKDSIIKIFKKLKGNKVLIMGNHDKRRSYEWWLNIGFKEVYKYPILYNSHFLLSHEPINYVPGPFLNIHGHIHSKSMNDQKKYYNVSCEAINYTPIDFEIIRDQHYN